MTPDDIDRVFGRGRLRMRTGRHVEVFREAAAAGERRCYTKRFLATTEGDFREWTEREWRILARLVGHGIRCVPEVAQFDRGTGGTTPLVKTFDAGVTVDHWATLLPVQREGLAARHVFDDCAHWWALAHHSLRALDEIHALQLIHLDIKADNVCIPLGPPGFDPHRPGERLHPVFERLSLIDFAFSLVAGENLTTPLPIGWQPEYDYQSPRLLDALEAGRQGNLEPTRELDWRCDLFSLAAMLERYLPEPARVGTADGAPGWTGARFAHAQSVLQRIRDSHNADASEEQPHQALIEFSGAPLAESDLAASLERGWMLAESVSTAAAGARPTPVTRLAPALRPTPMTNVAPLGGASAGEAQPGSAMQRLRRRLRLRRLTVPAVIVVATLIAAPFVFDAMRSGAEAVRSAAAAGRSVADAVRAVAGGKESSPAELTARAKRILSNGLPRVAALAEKEVAWVMFLAGNAASADDDDDVAAAAARMKAVPDLLDSGVARGDARKLNEQALDSLWSRRNVGEAFNLQLRAFGANPQDPDVVGNLAFLHLRLSPPQAETARQLAMVTLALRHARQRAGRPEDWTMLAVTSALTRRDQDARHALFVMAAITKDLDASCRLALSTVTSYGERMKVPVEAMLYRLRSRGGAKIPPSCAWPPNWSARYS